jgi:hypothetical protein
MGALLSLDISSNSLSAKGTKLLAEALESNQTMTSLNISSNSMAFDGKRNRDISGFAALADAIKDMKALTKLNVSDNGLRERHGKVLGEMLKANSTLLELNLSKNYGGAGFACETFKGLVNNGTLTALDISANNMVHTSEWIRVKDMNVGDVHEGEPVVEVLNNTLIKIKYVSGIRALEDAIKGSMVLLSLDLTENRIETGDMASIIRVLKRRAIQHQRACICLVGHELTTKDLRALLVATYNLNPRCWLLANRSTLDIATWL